MANDLPVSHPSHMDASLSPPPEAAILPEGRNTGSRPLEAETHDDIAPMAAEDPVAFQTTQDLESPESNIPIAITRKLYISHFLSTWNSRSFEFAAVLFLASIFPMTLLPLSIYALVRSASAITIAPMVGRTIDRKSRLPVLRLSIGKSRPDECPEMRDMLTSAPLVVRSCRSNFSHNFLPWFLGSLHL